MKKFVKYLMILAVALTVSLAIPSISNAGNVSNLDPFGVDNMEGIVLSGDVSPDTAVKNIINLALSFLGLIALVIILIGGFKWMTAGGNEDKVGEAKKLIGAGVVGLIIVIAAWGIAKWVIEIVNNNIISNS
jgi:hypothetical protein